MAMLCYVLAALCLVYCVGVVATKAAGTKFYLIWLAGTALFGLFGFFVQKGLWMRLPIGLRAGIGVLAGVGIACLCGLLVLIGSTFSAKGEQQLSYLIVLGAQMKPNGPSVVLEKRLRRAYTYLTENPETLCVLSGGQGSNEPVSEAQGMYEDLVKKGIDPKRLILDCLLYTSDAADEEDSVDIDGRRDIQKKEKNKLRDGCEGLLMPFHDRCIHREHADESILNYACNHQRIQ